MTMPQQPASARAAEFSAGAGGTGGSAYPASSLDVQQASAAFDASGSTQMIPNAIRTPNGMSPKTYMSTMLPYAAKSSPMAQAQAQEGDQLA